MVLLILKPRSHYSMKRRFRRWLNASLFIIILRICFSEPLVTMFWSQYEIVQTSTLRHHWYTRVHVVPGLKKKLYRQMERTVHVIDCIVQTKVTHIGELLTSGIEKWSKISIINAIIILFSLLVGKRQLELINEM